MAFLFATPQKDYAASYIEALREGLDVSPTSPEEITLIEENFDVWHKNKNDLSKPVILPDGRAIQRVPETTIWLIDGTRFLGRVSIRHSLTDSLKMEGGHIGYAVRLSERGKGYGTLLLNEALKFAGTIGLKKVLLTCNDQNAGSIKLIENAGGKLSDKIMMPGKEIPNRLYWIDLAPPNHNTVSQFTNDGPPR